MTAFACIFLLQVNTECEMRSTETTSKVLYRGGVILLTSAVLLGLRLGFIMLLLTGCAVVPHPRPWTGREKAAAAFFVTAHTVNAISTERHLDISGNYEYNPILGRYPSDRRVNTYFSITGLGTLLIAHLYPELREPLLIGYGGINAGWAVYDFSK